jgi:hypothetical protein
VRRIDADGGNGSRFVGRQMPPRLSTCRNGQTNATGSVGNWKFNPVSRSYNPLNNSFSNENFAAILIGEVNGD